MPLRACRFESDHWYQIKRAPFRSFFYAFHFLTRYPEHIDLEGLANHRGSSFGRRLGGQPTQIGFENALSIALLKARHQGKTTLVLEDESKLIGRCSLPDTLREKMQQAPILLLEESLETRVQITFEEYIEQNLAENLEQFANSLLAAWSASVNAWAVCDISISDRP